MMKYTILFILLNLAGQACKTRASIQQANHKEAPPAVQLGVNTEGAAEDKIVYLTFEVQLIDSTLDLYSFTLKHKVLAAGRLKENFGGAPYIADSNALFYQLATDTTTTRQLVKIQNPLRKTIEYSPAERQLEVKTIYRTKGDLTIRFQMEKGIRYLSFYKLQPHSATLKRIYHALL